MLEVFACRLPQVHSEVTLHHYSDYLPPLKRTQIQRYRRIEDAYRTLVGYLLLRKILMKKLPKVDLTKLEFSKYGKPFLNADPFPPFSLSHSGDWCVCAVGTDGMVGIDLEKITKPKPELHSLLFREEEECMGAKDFFNRWTIKESYLKAIGTGLLVDLQEIELEEKNRSEFDVNHQQKRYPGGKVKVYNLLKQYSLSICTLSTEEKLPHHLQLVTFEEIIKPSVQTV
ncbi:4'-phosphopantetheinyl transferase superfamily protein [Cytobacillus sp. FSL W7-1323]|uniref:4'-phosphopantetheinyl transferase family protein n=1 Tax=Cytobacillus sp. FSL W7-1323 TaxID=2921700 RepID=UPI0031598DCC